MCVVRTWNNVRLKVLILDNVLNTHIIGVEWLESFLRAREGQEVNFFSSVEQNPKISDGEKLEFGGQNDLDCVFFLKCLWGVWEMKESYLGCFKLISSFVNTVDSCIEVALPESQHKFVKMTFFWVWKWLPSTRSSRYYVSFCLCALYGHDTKCVWRPWSWAMF